VLQVLVTDKPIPEVNKPAVLVVAQDAFGNQYVFWINLASNNADRMLTSVMTALEKNYPVMFNQGAVNPDGMPKEAVDTVILVNPLALKGI
jgi:hypothetical protein